MPICTNCYLDKMEGEFSPRKNRKKTVASMCLNCRRDYGNKWYHQNKGKAKEIAKKTYIKNRDKNLKRHCKWYLKNKVVEKRKSLLSYYSTRESNINSVKQYQKSNKDKYQKTQQKWRKENSDYVKRRYKKWAKQNPDKIRGYYNQRQKHIHQATPKWADMDKINEIYKESARISEETGIPHHVDHIVPLVHPDVCGLHVHANLRVISATENCKKSNKYILNDI